MADATTDPLKTRLDTIINNLELATGEILLRDKQLAPSSQKRGNSSSRCGRCSA